MRTVLTGKATVTVVVALLVGLGGVMGPGLRPSSPARATSAHLVAASSSAPGLGIRLLPTETDAPQDARQKDYIVQTGRPGTSIRRQVQITNRTGATQSVQIFATAATIGHGQFGITDTVQNPLSTWTRPAQDTVRLQDGEHADVTVEIAIPPNATRGEQYAVLWAAISAHGTHSGSAVTVVNRVGIRIYLDVATTNQATTSFRVTSASAGTSRAGPIVTTALENTGDLATDITGTVQLTDGPGSTRAGPFLANRTTTLAPHQRADARFVLPAGISPDPWNITATLHSGTITHTKTVTLTLPTRKHNPTNAPSYVSAAIFTTVGVLLLLGVLALRHYGRRKRRTLTARNDR